MKTGSIFKACLTEASKWAREALKSHPNVKKLTFELTHHRADVSIEYPWSPMERTESTDDQLHGFDAMWANNQFVVLSRRASDDVVWLSIRTTTRDVSRDWRSYQRLKNELVGTECEAFEIYPKESRLVDGANQFHLWCLRPDLQLPTGYPSRDVLSPTELVQEGSKAVQREFDDHHNADGCEKIGPVWKMYLSEEEIEEIQKKLES